VCDLKSAVISVAASTGFGRGFLDGLAIQLAPRLRRTTNRPGALCPGRLNQSRPRSHFRRGAGSAVSAISAPACRQARRSSAKCSGCSVDDEVGSKAIRWAVEAAVLGGGLQWPAKIKIWTAGTRRPPAGLVPHGQATRQHTGEEPAPRRVADGRQIFGPLAGAIIPPLQLSEGGLRLSEGVSGAGGVRLRSKMVGGRVDNYRKTPTAF
jgi:hypothetical protein